MSSKRDKLKNAMSKNIFNYEKEAFTPVDDLVEALPIIESDTKPYNENNTNNIKKTNDSIQENTKKEESAVNTFSFDDDDSDANETIINIAVKDTNASNISKTETTKTPNIDVSNPDIADNLEPIKELPILDKENIVSQTPISYEVPEELSVLPLESNSLELFKNNNSINDTETSLASIKAYFSKETKNVSPISIRLDKELDVFSKIEAYKNKLTLNMYYNYIIFKDMQINAQAQNFNPTFDLNNNALYRKTPAYNSVQKTFSIIPELKEYIAIYGAKLGVTPGNYFKYLLRKEYEKSENSCIN